MGKKKTQRQADFQKVKLKVGKKILKSQNETKITVKAKQIVIKEQLKSKNHLREAMTRKRLTIAELLVHLAHYNPTMRYEGISGLNELVARESETVLSHVAAILERLSPIFVDKDVNVRKGARNLLKKLFAIIPVDRMEPFFALPMAHLCCAMTHIDEDIRRDSLDVVDVCLRFYPSLVVRDVERFLDHFLLQISTTTKKRAEAGGLSGAKLTSTLLVSPSNRISTVKWRAEVFKRLITVFEALTAEVDGGGGSGKGDEDETSIGRLDNAGTLIDDIRIDVLDVITVGSFNLRNSLHSRQKLSSSIVPMKSLASSLDCAALQAFGETIVPLLIDSWMEASPSDINVSRGQNKSVSHEVFELFASITSLLQLLLNFSTKIHVETDSSLRSTFFRKFLPDLAKRFIPFFPLLPPPQQHRKRDSTSEATSSGVVSSASFVNLAICDVLTFDARILLKSDPPSWVQTVFDHLEGFFSSKLSLASESELSLAFRIIDRCLKSPIFAAKYLRKIFNDVTSNFFQLSVEPQILFLNFFLEFLEEFSILLSHEDSFLSDAAIKTWLANLPTYLKSVLIKGKNNNNNNNDDDDVEASSQAKANAKFDRVEVLAEKISRLFTTASRMNLGAFFPLRLFLTKMMTRRVFDSISSSHNLQRSLVVVAGHADLTDETLLAHFAKFLGEDYHRRHRFLLETMFYNLAETRGRRKVVVAVDERSLVALLLSVVLDEPYFDTKSLIERRFGVYYLIPRRGEDGDNSEGSCLKDFLASSSSSSRVDVVDEKKRHALEFLKSLLES